MSFYTYLFKKLYEYEQRFLMREQSNSFHYNKERIQERVNKIISLSVMRTVWELSLGYRLEILHKALWSHIQY